MTRHASGRRGLSGIALLTLLLLASTLGFVVSADARGGQQWFTAAAFSQQALGPLTEAANDETVRMVQRVTVAGNFVRVKLENTFGIEPVTIGEAFVGLRGTGAALVGGSNRRLTFSGLPSVTIAAGDGVYSDPVRLTVAAQQDVAVSLYVPGTSVQASWHGNARITSYRTAPLAGNHAADEGGAAFTATTTRMLWVTAIDVFAPSVTGAVVCFGDSITDGTGSTVDAHDRWHDVLARRLLELPAVQRKSVVNEGIGGNTITHTTPPGTGPAAIDRLDRDVLDRAGVTHVIFFEGTNDIQRNATATQVITGAQEVIDRVHAAGLRIIGVTIIPRHNATWTSTMTDYRHQVNDWIRNVANFDAVIDFDARVRDPADPDHINPLYDLGDHIHPNPTGYAAMGEAIDLALFDNVAEWAAGR
jgi:lysophospholipase L1-like esterase